MMSAAVAIVFAYHFDLSLWLSLLVLAVWSFSIALSRIYLGAHYVQDIVAGWIVGVIYGVILTQLFPLLRVSPFLPSLLIVAIFSLHPVDRSNSLHFHISEGTLDTSISLLGVVVAAIVAEWTIPKATCASLSPSLFLRFIIGLPIQAVRTIIQSFSIIKSICPTLMTTNSQPRFCTLEPSVSSRQWRILSFVI